MQRPVTLRRLLRFWLPLEATWLMMAVEGPFLAAVIARLAEPTVNLAAYGVAYAFAIIVEAPVIMMMSAATAVIDARPGYLALRRFSIALNGGITVVMVVLLATPAAIGYRRFYLGILIRAGLTRRVAWGTVARLVAMAAGALVARAHGLPGAVVGAVALSSGAARIAGRPAGAQRAGVHLPHAGAQLPGGGHRHAGRGPAEQPAGAGLRGSAGGGVHPGAAPDGLDPGLAAFAVVPLRILGLMPLLSVLLNLQRALLVHDRRTGPVTTASIMEVAGLAMVLAVGVLGLGAVGVVAAAAAFVVGRLAGNLSLVRPALRVLRRS